MTEHDVLVGCRLRLFTLADELGNVPAACRGMAVSRSTYYRWKAKVDRSGLEALRVRGRRRPADAEPDRAAPRGLRARPREEVPTQPATSRRNRTGDQGAEYSSQRPQSLYLDDVALNGGLVAGGASR